VAEAKLISQRKDFKGYILDLGGPTANMYGFECKKKLAYGVCKDRRCLFPEPCKTLHPDHANHMKLIGQVEKLDKVKKVFISSGIRYELIFSDKKNGTAYLKKIVTDNISGQMKIAPEHVDPGVLNLMGKPKADLLLQFKQQFDRISGLSGKKQFLTYYLIAAHPGCGMKHMAALKEFTRKKLNISPEQVQIFTPSPSTYSTLMYATGRDPFSMEPVFVEKDPQKKDAQKNIVTQKPQVRRPPQKRKDSKKARPWGSKPKKKQ
jgi:uncharacterized radical SAM protein YgiQ